LRSLELWGLAGALVAVALAGGAPATAPPPSGATLRYPDFVFPSTPAALARAGQSALVQRGWQALQAGDASGARREFSSAIRVNAAFYPADAALGYASLAEKDYADAVTCFSRVLTRDARYVPALVGRGDALAGAGQLDEAIRDLGAAVAESPSLVNVRRRLDVLAFRRQQESLQSARAAAAAGRLEEAAAAYQRAIERSPDSALLYRELAAVERRQGRADQATDHFRKAVSLDPGDARSLVQLGELLEARRDFGAAADAYSKAYAIEPGEDIRGRLAEAQARDSMSRLPDQFQAIAKAPQITRGDLAALLGVRLGALLESAPHREGVVVTDVRGHWAAAWIVAVARAGVMEPYPNHEFGPRDVLQRLDLAQAASRVLKLIEARRPKLAREWQSERLRIADLPPDHLGYPAAALVVGAGVMPLVDGSAFRPARPVAGIEAIDVVTRLEGLLR
jgi:tetratricopeptide (TPR) repeat protein